MDEKKPNIINWKRTRANIVYFETDYAKTP